jgi:predicted CXXCH cytochrome family protein
MALTATLLTIPCLVTGGPEFNPHGDPTSGVLRVITAPSSRGECFQCHPQHGDESLTASEELLFAENTNDLAFFSQGAAPCHGAKPTSYPLPDADRMPETDADAGYPEANIGGVRTPGLDFRGRWPGETVWSDATVTTGGNFVSPHAWDPDMPRIDPGGQGSCHNCHDPHGSVGRFDLLTDNYGGVAGHSDVGPPQSYDLCLSCHGPMGPFGMDPENRNIRDYYDPGLNGDTAGHQIRLDSNNVLSWPANIQAGDMLPCYVCHNPHGSEGNDRVSPNGYLINDDRTGWSGLTNTRGQADQGRRFCLGCHIESDGIPGSRSVLGIVMNTLPDENGHESTDNRNCQRCHGSDYSGPTSYNVHHPNDNPPGENVGFPSGIRGFD